MTLCVCSYQSIDTYFRIDQLIAGEVNPILVQKEFSGGKGIYVPLAWKELGE